MIAYLRGNLVVWVGGDSEAPPMLLAWDGILPGPASIGQVWNGAAFVAPGVGSEQANVAALYAQADDALASLQAAIDQTVTWRTNGAGAGAANLTSAQLSAAERQSADNQVATMRVVKGIIRLLRAKLDATN